MTQPTAKQLEVTQALAKIAGLLRINIHEGDRRMAIENCNNLIHYLETGKFFNDLSSSRAFSEEVQSRIESEQPLVCALGPHLTAIQATEARAQGLVELLEMVDSIEYKELNLSNYTHDDVCALNNVYVEMQLILTQALATWRRT